MRTWHAHSDVKRYQKCHAMVVPKYRRRSIYGALRRDIRGTVRDLCQQKGGENVDGHAIRDPIHLCPIIPPQLTAANTKGFLQQLPCVVLHVIRAPCVARVHSRHLQVQRATPMFRNRSLRTASVLVA